MSIDSQNRHMEKSRHDAASKLDQLSAVIMDRGLLVDNIDFSTMPDVPPIDTTIKLNQRIAPQTFPDSMVVNGKIKLLPTTNNLKHLIDSYKIVMIYDEAIKSQEIVIPSAEYANHDLTNEANIQRITDLAVINGLPTDIITRIPVLMQENTINPVKDWILSKQWDEKRRIGELCNTLVVSQDDRDLTRKIILTWLIQCVAALDKSEIGLTLNPNALPKYELVLVLQGAQGLNKTSWFKRLLPYQINGRRFSDRYIKDGSNLALDNKDSIKQNISCWINELGELDATFKKSDIAELKAFCSNSKDRIRLPYAKSECDFERSTSFCGSVNDEYFLNDTTGSRRFGVIKVLDIKPNDLDMQQVWREVWELYTEGEQWWMDKETEMALQKRNAEQHQTIDPVRDAILTRFNWDSEEMTWDNRMTMSQIYQVLFDKKPNQKDLNAIKPIVVSLGVEITTSKGLDRALMPQLK